MAVKKFKLTLTWLDAGGTVLAEESSWRVRRPIGKVSTKPPYDWAAAADRNIAYLIRIGEEGTPAPYREPGMPVWIWSAASPTPEPTRVVQAEVSTIRACSANSAAGTSGPRRAIPKRTPRASYRRSSGRRPAHAELGRPHGQFALKMARLAADWALKNRLPDKARCRCFPTRPSPRENSAVFLGERQHQSHAGFVGGARHGDHVRGDEGREVPGLCAAHRPSYRQVPVAPDGQFPLSGELQLGAVKEAYCTGGIQFRLLVEALSRHGVDEKLAMASECAVQWMLSYPVALFNWQAGYEDVGEVGRISI